DDKRKIATIDKLTVDERSLINLPVAVIRYQHDNHLGSASLELDATAQIISYEEYHPFGSTSYRSGKSETEVSLKRYKYVGKERDEETGLYYYGFRYYAPWIARFINVDPLQHEYPHYTPFQYAGNKPITYVDLDGLEEGVKDEGKSNFYLKQDDAVAKDDILLIVNKRHQKYIKFNEDGNVLFSKAFNDLSDKDKAKILTKDDGMMLIFDLINAKYKEKGAEDVEKKDAKMLYQSEGSFDFAGYLEDESKIPHNDYSPHSPGQEAVGKVKEETIAFSYNASISEYGLDLGGVKQLTLLPQKGFQGQVAIAAGDVKLYWGVKPEYLRPNSETGQWEKVKNESIITSGKAARRDLVMHELRENLFRLSGMEYNEAHEATNAFYKKSFEISSFKFLK
ncbi:MAG: RHS repeat-associated core domain-containing protein, partial [Bacteroidales bacterium]|nr:RHS repeat-associated core domain-containing protein [Bacteroidales bacterium]